MGFCRQEYWSRLPFPSLGDLPQPEIKLASLRLNTRFLENCPVISPPTNQEKVCTGWKIRKTDPLPK